MDDLNSLSDDELIKRASAKQAPVNNYDSMSDDELIALANKKSQTVQPQKEVASPQYNQAEAAQLALSKGATLGYSPQIGAASQLLVQKALEQTPQDYVGNQVGDYTDIGAPETFTDKKGNEFPVSRPEQSYVQWRDEILRAQNQAKEQNPWTSAAAELTGAAGLGLGVGKVAQALGMASEAAQSAGLGSRLLSAGASGATYGAIQNPGDTEGEISPLQLKERAINAGTGAATGVAIQGGLETLGSGASAVSRYLRPPSPATQAEGKIAQALAVAENERPVVQDELGLLNRIAKEQGLPEPTIAQARQGKAILAEKNLMDVPVYGKKIREAADEQVKAVRANLENEVGDFINAPTHPGRVGEMTKNLGEMNVELQKGEAVKLYDKVAEMASGAEINRKTVANKIKNNARNYGLFDLDGTPLRYRSDTGLRRDQFEKIQAVAADALEGLKSPVGDKNINYDSIVNTVRTIKSEAKALLKGENADPRSAKILRNIADDLDTSIQTALNKANPEAGATFKEATKRYAIYKDIEEIYTKLAGAKTSPEDVMNKIMSSSNNINSMKKVIGEEKMREIGMAHANDVLAKILPKSGEGRADSAITALKKMRTELETAIGEKSYQNIMDNLYYLNKTKEPIVISRESASNLWALAGGVGKIAGHTAQVAGNIKTSGRLPFKPTSLINPKTSGVIGAVLSRRDQ